jgi:hypothetical protein
MKRPSPDDPNGTALAADSSQWYVEQRLGLGTLRAFRGENYAAALRSTPAVNATQFKFERVLVVRFLERCNHAFDPALGRSPRAHSRQ